MKLIIKNYFSPGDEKLILINSIDYNNNLSTKFNLFQRE